MFAVIQGRSRNCIVCEAPLTGRQQKYCKLHANKSPFTRASELKKWKSLPVVGATCPTDEVDYGQMY
jgi:hypothetical protein